MADPPRKPNYGRRQPYGANVNRVMSKAQPPIMGERVSTALQDAESAERFRASLFELRENEQDDAQLGGQLIALFVENGILRGDVEIAHFRDDWFQGWFPQDPVATLFLEAFAFAADTALKNKLDTVEFLWLNSPDSHVRFSIVVSSVQVTIVLLTPDPLYDRYVVETEKLDPIWVVSAKDNVVSIDQVKQVKLIEETLFESIPRQVFRSALRLVRQATRRSPFGPRNSKTKPPL